MKPSPEKLAEAFARGLMQGLVGSQSESAPPVARTPRVKKAPMPGQMPLGIPTAWGGQAGKSMFEPDTTPPRPEDLDAMWSGKLSGNPIADAETLHEAAEHFGLRREPDADPAGTYRPGEEETPSWMRPPIQTTPQR